MIATAKKTLQVTMICLFGLLGLTTSAFAQNTFGEVQGRVFDENGQPLPFCDVYVEIQDGTPFGTITDIDGRFKLKPLTPGIYAVKFHMLGYSDLEKQNVEVKPDQIYFLREVNMTAGVEIGEVVIEVEQNPLIVPGEESKMVVLFKEIEKMPSVKNAQGLIAALVPGVSSPGDGELYFRGSRSDASGFYIDGVKMQGDLANLPSSAIGSITAYTGGVPAKYGDATGGIVVIETKSYFDLLRQWRIEQGNNQ